jgi:hypothetical protein
VKTYLISHKERPLELRNDGICHVFSIFIPGHRGQEMARARQAVGTCGETVRTMYRVITNLIQELLTLSQWSLALKEIYKADYSLITKIYDIMLKQGWEATTYCFTEFFLGDQKTEDLIFTREPVSLTYNAKIGQFKV